MQGPGHDLHEARPPVAFVSPVHISNLPPLTGLASAARERDCPEADQYHPQILRFNGNFSGNP